MCLTVDHPEWPIQRYYKRHLELMACSKDRKGCIKKPVMKFNATSCPPDMLHLKKGIISKLLNQVVDWAVIQGNEHKIMQQMKEHRIPFT